MYAESTKIIEHKHEKCSCGGGIKYKKKYIAKQYVDVELVAHIVEHRAFDGKCVCCGKSHKAALPQNLINPVTYGNNLKAMTVLLSCEGCVSVNRIKSMLTELTGGKIAISEGTIVNWLAETALKTAPELHEIKKKLLTSVVTHKDETPIDVGTALQWLHVLSSDKATCYHVDEKRGKLADEAMGILPLYKNTLVHDHLGSLIGLDCEHAECNAHILRYLKAAKENNNRKWAEEMRTLLVSAHRETFIDGQKQVLPCNRAKYYSRLYDRILSNGEKEFKLDLSPQKDYNGDDMKLLRRLKRFKKEHLLFLCRADVPFDNNLAERDLRMIKTKQKVSGCFRSAKGAQIFAALKSILSTAKKNNQNLFLKLKTLGSE